MVYVLDINGTPLMPTTRYGKVRRMLNENKARVVKRNPFTIQLNYEPESKCTDKIKLGVDTGRDTIGLSATYRNFRGNGEYVEVYSEKADTRKDVQSLVEQRRQLRTERRRRNDKRKGNPKKKGMKSNRKIKAAVTSHVYKSEVISNIKKVCSILPIDEIVIRTKEVSVNQMDTLVYSKNLRNDEHPNRNITIGGLRKSVFTRDGHTCQWCQDNKKSDILFSRRIDDWFARPEKSKYRQRALATMHTSIGRNITLCEKCKNKWDKVYNEYYDNGKINKKYKKKFYSVMDYIGKRCDKFHSTHDIKFGKLKDNIFDTLRCYSRQYGIRSEFREVYGIDVANYRHYLGIKYDPINNARIMSTFPYHSGDSAKNLKPLDHYYYSKHRRRHNRSIQKITPNKNGERPFKPPEYLYGFKSYDLVKYIGDKHPEYKGKCFFITKRRSNGYFALGHADGTTVLNSVKHNLLKLVKRSSAYSTEVIKQRIEYA